MEENTTYTNHSGEVIQVNSLETTHATNALAKKMREVFEAKTKEDAYKIINEINSLKEEIFKRINKYIETLGDEDGE